MNVIALVCVVSAGLAAGVLAAYGICTAMFTAFRMHAERLAPVGTAAGSQVPAGAAPAIGN